MGTGDGDRCPAQVRDPRAQLYGRSGQKQHGFDIRGRIDRDASRVFVIQCKQTSKPKLTKGILRTELDAAKEKHPELNQFVLATTAPRDADLQDELLKLQKKLAAESDATEVDVWSWDEIVEFCEADPELRRVFDPTHSTQQDAIASAQEVMRSDQQAHRRTLDGMDIKIDQLLAKADIRPLGVTDEDRRDTENHGRITGAIDLINDGQVDIARGQLERIEALELATEERFRLIEARAALLDRTRSGFSASC